jgi:anti-sigma regulatory factor (Ser/Thr protein kinase)
MGITASTPVPVIRSFRAHPSALFEIRQFTRRCAESSGLPRPVADALLLAVSEACANAIVHTTSPDVRVTWTAQGECVTVDVRDRGVFKRQVPMPEVDGRGGHGIPLMMALVDELSIKEGTASHPGTVVRLRMCVEGEPRDARA